MSQPEESKSSTNEGDLQKKDSKKKIKRRASVALQNETVGKFLLRSLMLVLLLLPVGVLFGVLFTSKGWGATVVIKLEPYYDVSRWIAASGVGLIVLLYLLDFSYWKGIWATIRTALLILSVLVITVGSILMAREYAALPMLVFLLLVPIYVALCRKTCWRHLDNYYFLSSLAPALFVMGLLGIGTWIILNVTPTPPEIWPGGDNIIKAKYFDKLLCKDHSLICKGLLCPKLKADDNLLDGKCPLFTEKNGCVMTTSEGHATGRYDVGQSGSRNNVSVHSWTQVVEMNVKYRKHVEDLKSKNKTTSLNSNSTNYFDPSMFPTIRDADVDCATAAYLLYVGLLVSSVMLVLFSVVTHFISRSLKRKSPRTQLRVFAMLAGLAVLGMWMATTIAGTTPQVANLVMLFSFVGMGVVALMAISAIGWGSIKTDLMNVPMIKSMAGAGESDWVKAMAMFLIVPYCCFLLLSCINQFFRKYLTPCAKKVGKKESKHCLTKIAHKQLVMIKKWPFTNLFKKIGFIGIVYYVMMIGISKFVMVFLSWLNGTLSVLPLGTVIGIFYGTGLFMFLLPPVPGVPVYVLGGVVLVNSFKRAGYSFGVGLFAVTMICWAIKLNAVAMQQKLIGGQMSGSLYVRKTVAVNSIAIKAIKKILSAPGLGIDKVAILCGGPDWPTSVLTGILRLSVFKMLFGSLPVVFLVFPCVMSGAFVNNPCSCDSPPCQITEEMPNPTCQTMEDTKALQSLFKGMATVSLLLASMVQSMALFAAGYFIETAASKHRELLLNDPEFKNDPEVEVADAIDAKQKRISDAATVWKRVPGCQKCNLIFMFLETMFYCIAFGTVASWCFVSFEVTDSIGYTQEKCTELLGTGPPDTKWKEAEHPKFKKPFSTEDNFNIVMQACLGKLKGRFWDVIIGETNVSTGMPGWYIGYIMNAFVVTALIHSQIFGCWASKAIKDVQNKMEANGLTVEDVVPEAFPKSTKVSPAGEGGGTSAFDDSDSEEEDGKSCRQQ